MQYSITGLSLDTAVKALRDNKFGLEFVTRSSNGDICYVYIWTDDDSTGEIGGYEVGSLSREIGMFATYTLTFTEHLNDKERIAAVITNVLRRKTIR